MEDAIAATEKLGHADFAACRGQLFRLSGEGGELTLAEVSAGQTGRGREHFTLLFEAPAEAPLAQGTHLLAHPALGEFALFLVPVGPQTDTPGTLCYEAVFNRQPAGATP